MAFLELNPDQYPSVRPLFANSLGHIPLLGALEDRHPARIFADDASQPTLALVAAQWDYFYIGGEPTGAEQASALGKLLAQMLLPERITLRRRGFILWPDQPGWFDWLTLLLPGRLLSRAYRRAFQFDPITFYENRFSRPPVPPGVEMQPIDASVLDVMEDNLAAEILASWRSIEDFLQTGVGACLTAQQGSRLASVCFAGFVAGGAADANVFTLPDYRRKGMATLTAAGFVEECMRHDLRPNWECFSDNLPSLKLAENLGFKAQADTPVLYWVENTGNRESSPEIHI